MTKKFYFRIALLLMTLWLLAPPTRASSLEDLSSLCRMAHGPHSPCGNENTTHYEYAEQTDYFIIPNVVAPGIWGLGPEMLCAKVFMKAAKSGLAKPAFRYSEVKCPGCPYPLTGCELGESSIILISDIFGDRSGGAEVINRRTCHEGGLAVECGDVKCKKHSSGTWWLQYRCSSCEYRDQNAHLACPKNVDGEEIKASPLE